MSANFTPNSSTLEQVSPFRHFCQKVLPLSYDNSLSYYELLCKVTTRLNQIIELCNELNIDTSNLYKAYEQLESYVNFYFDNLDFQKMVNNKLDEMVLNGEMDLVHRPFNFCKAMNIISSDTYETLHSLDDIRKQIVNDYIPSYINKCCVTVNIRPSIEDISAYESGTKTLEDIEMVMYPDYKTLEHYIDLANEYGIKVYHIKFHSTWLRDSSSDTVELKISKHFNGVLANLELLKQDGYTFEYIGVENETSEWVNNANTLSGLISCKAYGNVGIEGVPSTYFSDELLETVDFVAPHFYVSTSRLGADSNVDFVYSCMLNSGYDSRLKDTVLRAPNKPIIIGESGCKSQWNALYYPESWRLTDDIIETGEPQVMYISAMIKYLKDYPNIVSLNWWWDIVGGTANRIKQFQLKGV